MFIVHGSLELNLLVSSLSTRCVSDLNPTRNSVISERQIV